MALEKISLRSCRKKARNALRKAPFSCAISVLTFLCIFSWIGIPLLFYCASFAWGDLCVSFSGLVAYALAVFISLLWGAFLTAPLSFGMNALVIEYFQHEKVSFDSIFAYFTDFSRLKCAFSSFFFAKCRFAFCVGVIWLELHLGGRVAEALLAGGDAVRAAWVLGAVILFLILLVLFFCVSSANYFLIGAVSALSPMLSYRQCKAISFHKIRGYRWKAIKCNLHFLPHVIASLFLLGVPLFFLVPYMRASKLSFSLELLKC